MPKPVKTAFAALTLVAAGLAQAALPVGAPAPDFSTEAALGGQPFKFSLSDTLKKKGPVVLYFYPKAFTKGCTIEAHLFAEASEKFEAMGATVVGISNDSIDTLKKFSVEECRNKFAVAADAGAKVTKDYDAKLPVVDMSARISYLIDTQGRIAAVHADMKPEGHIETMLKAAEQLKATGKR
ncbi:peroxiredoxin [Pelomonas sp. SE-A7]|uniref:peroxiredoxin n=1 Tax=Pelomonas sp. SE-A7 TaxID=3054953 RepID=UPI00259CC528|nr:peroxiredoxin [Pelomonas sp. SE-A7]MDM4768177.1 peroxiredoxin [Pelomonas sp. SE-A7]